MKLLFQPQEFEQIPASGFEFLEFAVRKLAPGEHYQEDLGARELGLVVLGGTCTVETREATWKKVGKRTHVFDGLPYAVYLPVGTIYSVTAESACELAFCYCHATKPCPARLITPDDIEVEIRGGGNATRQINHILKPDFAADRLLIVEVYTPSGNWSSYPPHKHDVHNPPGEVDLEEIYYFRIDKPEGYAIQKVYTADKRLDLTLSVRDEQIVLIPEGYHPVVAAHGYNVYYLNALAGSARSMAASDDPEYAWVRKTWNEKDPRLPLVRK